MDRSRSRVSVISKRDYSYRAGACLLDSLQQRHLPARWAERRAIQVEAFPTVEPQALDRLAETLRQQIGKRPLSAHAHAEATVIHLPTAHLAHQAHHMGGALRVVRRQPFLEQRRHLQRQAQHHVRRTLRTGRMGFGEQALQFAVVDHRDHRRAQHPHRDAGLAHHPDRPQPRLGRRRAWLQDALELIVQAGEADHHRHQPLARQFGEQVEIAQDQRALGDDRHRVPIAQQHFEGLPGDRVLTLDGLVRIGVGTQVDRRTHIAGLGQLLLQHIGGVGLGNQFGFEIQPRRQVPIGMAGPRIAVDAAMLTPAIRIDRAIERQVRRVVARDDGLGRFDTHFGALGRRHFLMPAVVLDHADGGRETIVQVGRRAPATGRQRCRHENAPMRAYESLTMLERSRVGLGKILAGVTNLYQAGSLREFASGVLGQVSAVLGIGADGMLCVLAVNEREPAVLAATGVWAALADHGSLPPEHPLLGVFERALSEQQGQHSALGTVLPIHTFQQQSLCIAVCPPLAMADLQRELLELYCQRIAAAFDNQYLYDQVQKTQAATVALLAQAAEARHPGAAAHAGRVRALSEAIARRMCEQGVKDPELTPQLIATIGPASMLHDLGMTQACDGWADDAVYTPEQRADMQRHPDIGRSMLERAAANVEGYTYLNCGALIAGAHHERFDGSGYPQGLAGRAIPLCARIVGVADSYDGMTGPRRHRPARSCAAALAELQREAGRLYDPAVVAALADLAGPEGGCLAADSDIWHAPE